MNLPSGYTKIDYIEAAGNQYIKTGVTANQNTRVVAEFSGAPRTKEQHLFGCRTSTSSNDRFMFIAAGGSAPCYRSDFYNNNAKVPQKYNFTDKFKVDKNKNRLYLNDELVATNTNGTFSKKYEIWLLGSNTAGKASPSKSGTRLHSCKIYDNDVLVRDFIPCKQEDGSIGLYDIVNKLFYKNAGTGAFISGPISKPDPPYNVSYKIKNNYVTLTWDKPSDDVITYTVKYTKNNQLMYTETMENFSSTYAISPGNWTVSITSNTDALSSDAYTISFVINTILNPTNLNGVIDSNGIASITWTGTTDSNVLGYSIYMLSPMRVLVGYSPYGKPLFKFAFENNSLTDKLIEMSTFLQDTFLYQLEPRKQYTFAVVSSNKEYENIPEDGPKIHMYYSTSVSFKSFSLKPNPVYTKESLIISAEVTEKIDSTITTS